MESTECPCDFCVDPAQYLISMDKKVQDDFRIVIGDMASCPKCLPKCVGIGVRLFGNELSICGRVGVQ